MIDLDDSTVFFSPKPITYPRERTFTTLRLLALGSAIAAGWVLGNTHPEVAIGFVVIAALVLVVRGLLARSEK